MLNANLQVIKILKKHQHKADSAPTLSFSFLLLSSASCAIGRGDRGGGVDDLDTERATNARPAARQTAAQTATESARERLVQRHGGPAPHSTKFTAPHSEKFTAPHRAKFTCILSADKIYLQIFTVR